MILYNMLTPNGNLEPGVYTATVTNVKEYDNGDIRIIVEFEEKSKKGWLRKLFGVVTSIR